MRKYLRAMSATVLALVFVMGSQAAETPAQMAGKYQGTWEGGGAGGRFDLILEVGADGKLNGSVSVGGDQEYTANFTSFSLNGNALTAKYDFTPQPEAEIVLAATIEGGKATGTWVMQPKGQEQGLANGTWTAKK
jgi:hypothetical protein